MFRISTRIWCRKYVFSNSKRILYHNRNVSNKHGMELFQCQKQQSGSKTHGRTIYMKKYEDCIHNYVYSNCKMMSALNQSWNVSNKHRLNMFRMQTRWNHNHWAQTAMPRSVKTIYKPKKQEEKAEIIEEDVGKQTNARFNQLDIQMISKTIHQHVFSNYPKMSYSKQLINQCRDELEKHGMSAKQIESVEDVDLKLPPLEGDNIEEHFMNIGEKQSKPYRDLVNRLINRQLPRLPSKWEFQEGWTRYQPGKPPESVKFPKENCIIFDVEVCMRSGKLPTLATACSEQAWYGWVSKQLIDGSDNATIHYHHDMFIPIEDKSNYSTEKVIIGHNVSFDRAKIREQYFLEQSRSRFIDTMSLHVCIGGLTSYQRAVLKSKDDQDNDWKQYSSLNNLSDVHKLYCGSEIDKSQRDLFFDGSLAEIRDDFQNCMKYCGNDVVATHNILKQLFPLFLKRFPHPVTLAGILELGTAYLPVNQNWERYLDEAEHTYDDLEAEARLLLAKRADQACVLLHNDEYKRDLWMWDQDWEVKPLRIKKTKSKKVNNADNKQVNGDDDELPDPLDIKFAYLNEIEVVKTLLPGYPAWYKKLCQKPQQDWIPGPHLISTSMQITPKLLNLTWEGYPLHFIRGQGWGLLVPFTDEYDPDGSKLPIKELLLKCPLVINQSGDEDGKYNGNILKEVQDNLARKEYYSKANKPDKSGGAYSGSGIWCNTILNDCVFFFKLPHKDGVTHRVGNPLAKDFLNKFSENVLAGDTESASLVLDIARKLSYWRNNRDRIMGQQVVWLDSERTQGAIIPQVVVCGTLTRRAVEATWMTASNSRPDRIGSELRGMIQPPPGYKIVGADVDSQELWIASVLGDASQAKLHGATPLGWMTLSGSKADGTDMHSVTAKAVGISREHAKVINYARIYGAGQNFAEQLLRQFNPTMVPSEARRKAIKMFELTKGKRIYRLRPEFISNELEDIHYGKWPAFNLAKLHNKQLNDMFYDAKWIGGTESAMFNCLERIATQLKPKTPFLDGRLSRALEPQHVPDDKFLPTRVNWVVQSGAVDFLHLMLVSMRWLMQDRARFCLSFHDEVRYIVPDEHRYQAALALHVTNLFTRAFCSARLGIYDLPRSVAWFTSVEVDGALRKEAQLDCKTPSNPHGLENGYGIPHGESLDVHTTVKKANGDRKTWWYNSA